MKMFCESDRPHSSHGGGGDIDTLPPEIREAYLDVIEYHHELLQRLAQR